MHTCICGFHLRCDLLGEFHWFEVLAWLFLGPSGCAPHWATALASGSVPGGPAEHGRCAVQQTLSSGDLGLDGGSISDGAGVPWLVSQGDKGPRGGGGQTSRPPWPLACPEQASALRQRGQETGALGRVALGLLHHCAHHSAALGLLNERGSRHRQRSGHDAEGELSPCPLCCLPFLRGGTERVASPPHTHAGWRALQVVPMRKHKTEALKGSSAVLRFTKHFARRHRDQNRKHPSCPQGTRG